MTTTDERDDAPPAPDGERRHHRLRRNPAYNLGYRIAVGVIGTIVLVAGIIMIPYPGPGWLVVFAGLAILSTEFEWAGKVLAYAKDRYDQWVEWLKRQSRLVQVLLAAFTCLVVLVSCWLLGAFELVGGWLGIEETWLESPIL